jgi:hypothetical protein
MPTCGECEYEPDCGHGSFASTECPARTAQRKAEKEAQEIIEGCKTAWCDPIKKLQAERDKLRAEAPCPDCRGKAYNFYCPTCKEWYQVSGLCPVCGTKKVDCPSCGGTNKKYT